MLFTNKVGFSSDVSSLMLLKDIKPFTYSAENQKHCLSVSRWQQQQQQCGGGVCADLLLPPAAVPYHLLHPHEEEEE